MADSSPTTDAPAARPKAGPDATSTSEKPPTSESGASGEPQGPLAKFKSKKQSATGFWEDDKKVTHCHKCEAKFGFTVRKHHCRWCGRIFCGKCCNQQFLLEELSRSGKPKRICDWCFAHSRGLDEVEPNTPDEEVADLKLSDKQQSTSSSHEEGTSTPENPHEAARLAHELPEIPIEEAVEALDKIHFEGQWLLTMYFHTVDMKNSPNVGMPLKSAPSDAFRGPSQPGRGGKRRRSTKPDSTLKPGSKRRAIMELHPKGKAYFRGNCRELNPFGKDGKITGSIQRMNGQVSTQLQLKSANGVTTSFNLVGRVNKEGTYLGTFSGCEIAKSAGAVSGTFEAKVLEEEHSSGEDSSDGAKEKRNQRSSTTNKRTSRVGKSASAVKRSSQASMNSEEDEHRKSSSAHDEDVAKPEKTESNSEEETKPAAPHEEDTGEGSEEQPKGDDDTNDAEAQPEVTEASEQDTRQTDEPPEIPQQSTEQGSEQPEEAETQPESTQQAEDTETQQESSGQGDEKAEDAEGQQESTEQGTDEQAEDTEAQQESSGPGNEQAEGTEAQQESTEQDAEDHADESAATDGQQETTDQGNDQQPDESAATGEQQEATEQGNEEYGTTDAGSQKESTEQGNEESTAAAEDGAQPDTSEQGE